MTVTKDDVLTRMLYSLSDATQPRELRKDEGQESHAGEDWKFRPVHTYAEWSGEAVRQRNRSGQRFKMIY